MIQSKAALHKEKGNDFFKKHNFKGAIEQYSSAIELCNVETTEDVSLKVLSLSNRALCHFKMKNYQLCVDDCTKATILDPLCVKAWYRRGLAYQELQQFSEAVSDLQMVKSLDKELGKQLATALVNELQKRNLTIAEFLGDKKPREAAKVWNTDDNEQDGSEHSFSSMDVMTSHSGISSNELMNSTTPPNLAASERETPNVWNTDENDQDDMEQSVSSTEFLSYDSPVPVNNDKKDIQCNFIPPASASCRLGSNVITLNFSSSENDHQAVPSPHPSLKSYFPENQLINRNNREQSNPDMHNLPSRYRQRTDIFRLLKQANQKALEEGDVWYVVHYKWMEKWRAFVGYKEIERQEMDCSLDIADSTAGDLSVRRNSSTSSLFVDLNIEDEQTGEENRTSHPPPIDNTPLIKMPDDGGDPHLQLRLVQGYHFELLPQEVWEALHQWYGGGPALPRIAANTAPDATCPKHITVILYPELARLHNATLDSADTDNTEQSLEGMSNEKADVSSKRPCDACQAPFASSKCTRCQSAFYCDKRCQASAWRYHKEACSVPPSPKSILAKGTRSWQSKPLVPRRGKVGLINLGNTCFMNSSLQCLSHAAPLTRHFLSNKWKEDLNESNPLGTGGRLAKEYDHLIKELWFGYKHHISPTGLKQAISRFAPQFSGFAQHDAQELLVFLIDGIHEDLNRVSVKPYVEMPDGGDGRPDKIVSAEAWEKYQSRNQSIVIDHFCGLFKSTLVCPVCGKISIVFDPYNVVPLDLSSRHEQIVHVFVLKQDGERPIKYAVRVESTGTMGQVKEKLSNICNLDSAKMFLVEIYQNRFYQSFKDQFPVSKIRNDDIIVAYEVVPLNHESRHAFLYNRWFGGSKPELFDIPLVLSFESKWSTLKLKRHVFDQLTRYFNFDAKKVSELPDVYDQLIRSIQVCEVSQNGLSHSHSGSESDDHFAEQYTSLGKYLPSSEETSCAEFLDFPINTVGFLAMDWKGAWMQKLNKEEVDVVQDDKSVTDEMAEDSKAVTLQQCFQKFTQPEKLSKDNAWFCNKCKDFRQATKTLQLWRIPNILILVLKRFEYRNSLFREKLEMFIDFPINGLDMTSFCLGETIAAVYDLFAVSNHMGGMGFGHYTACAREWTETGLGEQWYHFDDSNVTEIHEDKVKSKSAYILFYRRRNFY